MHKNFLPPFFGYYQFVTKERHGNYLHEERFSNLGAMSNCM